MYVGIINAKKPLEKHAKQKRIIEDEHLIQQANNRVRCLPNYRTILYILKYLFIVHDGDKIVYLNYERYFLIISLGTLFYLC